MEIELLLDRIGQVRLCSPGCPPGWKHHKDSCYKPFDEENERADFATAVQRCKDLGAELSTAVDRQEQDFLLGFRITYMYVNLKKPYEVWGNGVPVTYTAWGKGQPFKIK